MNRTSITSSSDLEEIRGYFDIFPEDLFFTVSSERFRPVAGEEVVELTSADAGLFEGCETQEVWERNWPYLSEAHHCFGIVRDGKVASSTYVGPIHDQFRDSDLPPGELESPVIAISGLHTETRYRRMGLGKRLVSYQWFGHFS